MRTYLAADMPRRLRRNTQVIKTQIPRVGASLKPGFWDLEIRAERARVADGTRTRNSQNHNLELYH